MKDKLDPAFVGALISLASLGAAQYWPSMVCAVCRKPIESGTGYRDIRGIGACHPECDPREPKETAK